MPLAPGSEREAGAQLLSARIGPEGADVTRLLGALLGGNDAPPQLGSNFPAGRVRRRGLLGARFENWNEEGQQRAPNRRVLSSPKLGPESWGAAGG